MDDKAGVCMRIHLTLPYLAFIHNFTYIPVGFFFPKKRPKRHVASRASSFYPLFIGGGVFFLKGKLT